MDVRISCRILNGDLFFFSLVDVVVEAPRDRIPTTTASENTLRLACSFVLTLFEGTKQRVTHVY